MSKWIHWGFFVSVSSNDFTGMILQVWFYRNHNIIVHNCDWGPVGSISWSLLGTQQSLLGTNPNHQKFVNPGLRVWTLREKSDPLAQHVRHLPEGLRLMALEELRLDICQTTRLICCSWMKEIERSWSSSQIHKALLWAWGLTRWLPGENQDGWLGVTSWSSATG